MVAFNNNNKKGGYKDTGISTDTVDTAVNVGRMASNFIPGGKVVQGGVDAALAGIQGDVEADKEEKRLTDTGLKLDKHEGKFNPAIRGHLEKLRSRYKGRMAEAGVTAVGAAGFGAAAVAGVTAAGLSGPAAPLVGPIGAAAALLIGGAGGGAVASKAYNTVFPLDDKDEVDLMVKIVEAQKQGQAVPPEVAFAQWAAMQKGPMDATLKADLKASTGLTNFNDAVEQGQMGALNKMMQKPEYEQAMRAYTGISIDSQNPYKNVAEQTAEWLNTGMLQGKDMLLGSAHIPNMSLADAQREGYLSDEIAAPTLQMGIDAREQAVKEGRSV